jgi:hypothetical protein
MGMWMMSNAEAALFISVVVVLVAAALMVTG